MKNTLNIKKITKLSLVGLVSLSLVGGGSAFAFDSIEDSFEQKARNEQITLLLNQAKSENINLKNINEIKDIVAKEINKDKNSIRFEKIELFDTYSTGQGNVRFYNEDRYDNDNDGDDRDYISLPSDSNNGTNSQSKEYVYKVSAEEGFMEYRLIIDAKTGKVVSSRVDN